MIQEDNKSFYRPNIGVVLFNRDGQVFFGRRIAASSAEGHSDKLKAYRWQMPQGGIDTGEDIHMAAFRELQEETGIRCAVLLTITPGWLIYDFPEEYARQNWKGQRQKWAAMLFQGNDGDVDLNADKNQEFDAWQWGELEDAIDLIVPFKRAVYKEMVAAFIPLRDFIRSL